MTSKKLSTAVTLSRHVAVLRIAFGLMWAADASFKWSNAFANGFLNQINSAAQGQPPWLQPWFNGWSHIISSSPHVFATLTAITESTIAVALVFGFARRTVYLAAAAFSLLLWSIPEGFGGPYTSSSTDIGTGIIYAVVFFAIYGLDRLSGRVSWSVDPTLARLLPWWPVVSEPSGHRPSLRD